MELQKERFAISFNPRHRLFQVSLVVECGLGGGGISSERRCGRTDAQLESPASADDRPAASPCRGRAVRASQRMRRRARVARQSH
ncbi:MAG TPA: hypothetical protein VFX96_13485 [Pyrinomonadaceae bacterium]|nr:hypothetical protein [Pyrinomonadaceae bacterium]